MMGIIFTLIYGLFGLPILFMDKDDCFVVSVRDGDSFKGYTRRGVWFNGRLAFYDANESKQPYGDESTAALRSKAEGRWVQFKAFRMCKYGRRYVGEMIVKDRSVNEEMISEGHARAYMARKYHRKLEAIARSLRKGMWKKRKFWRVTAQNWRKGER